MKRSSTSVGIAFWLFCASASAQVILDTLSIAPPNPTITDNIVASAGGMVNVSDLPDFRTEWKREGNNILMDILHDFVAAGAPPQMLPYSEQAVLGTLPAGTYDLTARLFSSFRDFPPPTYEQPWTFPSMDLRLRSTLSTTVTVVPEPSSLSLAIAGILLLLRWDRRAQHIQ
jgi:hypothetical protein